MNEVRQVPIEELKIEANELYKEEIFTDLRVGSIKVLTPVTEDGSRDLARPVEFIGQTQLMSQVGPLPVHAKIDAANLAEAIRKFPQAIQEAVAAMVEEIKELQRQEMSRIVVPGAEATSKILGPK